MVLGGLMTVNCALYVKMHRVRVSPQMASTMSFAVVALIKRYSQALLLSKAEDETMNFIGGVGL